MEKFGSMASQDSLTLFSTSHDVLGIGNVKALFGTAPGFWNTLLGIMAQLPPSLLSNEEIMTKLALFSLPIVRVVDFFAGATNAMRVDVTASTHTSARATAIYGHPNLEPCVGECVVAFGCAVLSQRVPPGVWFPEEGVAAGKDAASVLQLASVGAHTTEVDGTFDIVPTEVWGNSNVRV